ncbi:MAG: alpha/beta fold hydrolase [Candidatus Thorarchaeota archaeon]
MPIAKLRYTVFILATVLMISGVGLAATVQGGLGTVSVIEVDFQASDGSNIHGTLQTPLHSSGPLPGVLVIHGSLQSKEWLMAFGIELARRGFVVLTIDANGHGNSDRGRGSGAAALDYLATLPSVDNTRIGVVGHSMGGGIAREAISESSVVVNAFVAIGSWVSWANTTYPNNLLVAVGDFDSLSSYPSNPALLQDVFGTLDITPGTIYGSFSDGTARMIVIPRTNHLFETIDPTIVSETVDWMRNSLKGGVEDEYWLPKGNLIYGWWLLGGLLSTGGAILSIFPILTILFDTTPFSVLKRDEKEGYAGAASRRTYLVWGATYAVLSVGSFYPLLGVGSLLQLLIPFSQYMALPIMSWIVGVSVIASLALRVAVSRGIDVGIIRSGFRIQKTTEITFKQYIVRTMLLSILIISWLYGLTLLVDLNFALDFRCFLPGLNDLTISRALVFPLYAIVFIGFFMVESMWIMGILRTHNREPWMRGMVIWTSESVFIKCIPYALLVLAELTVGFVLGQPLIPGILGYSFLFFYAFLPWFAVSSIITVWCFRETGTYYLGALINGLLFGWILATILPF